MIAKKEDSEPIAETPLPNSRKVYVAGKLHVDLRVPFREISLAPTKTMSGEIEVNEPVRVYDTSGPWGDADVDVDVTCGLPALRAKWIRDRAVADVGVDLYQEITADDHRLGFRVIDVRRDNGAPARDLVADKFGCDLARDVRAKTFAGMLVCERICGASF
jgi:hypothetical protein